MKCLLKVNLDDEQCRAVDAACVQQTARAGALVNRSDLVRLWIAAGCPVVPEQVVGTDRYLDRAACPHLSTTQSPKPAGADSAAAPDAGAGWRELKLGETIRTDDEYYHPEKDCWLMAVGSIGEKVESGTLFRRKLTSAAAPVPAGSENAGPPAVGGIQWGFKPMCVHDWKPNADKSEVCSSCGAIWIPDMKKSASNQPAADANAGAAPARLPITKPGGKI